MYMKYLSIHLRSVMQHKLSFLMTVIGHIMTSLSAAIVVMMLFNRFGTVEGFTLEQAVKRAKDYISGALAAMLDLGAGSGPMNHAFDLQGEFAKEAE